MKFISEISRKFEYLKNLFCTFIAIKLHLSNLNLEKFWKKKKKYNFKVNLNAS